MAGVGGLAIGLGSLGSGIAGLFGGGNSSPPPQQILPNVGSTAQNFQSGVSGLGQYNTAGQVLPQYGAITQGLVNNPYAGGYQSGANTAGQMGMTAGANAFAGGSGLYGYGTQVMNTAMDPQQALYNQTLQQVTNQQNVQNANAGVATSPYGAGLTDMNIGNFNIDWQNAQLVRQIAGLGAAGTAYDQGANLQSGGVGTYLQGAGLPYSTFGQIGQGQLGALQGYGQAGQTAAAIPTTQNQENLAYLNAAANQQAVNNQTAQIGFGQNQQFGGAIGTGIGALAGMGYGGGGTPWTNYFGGAAPSSYQNVSYGDPTAGV